MLVGAARVVALVAASHSLKEKRAVVRRVKARVRAALELPVAEVGAQDTWQRVELGVAVAGSDRAVLERLLADAAAVIAAEDGVEVIDVATDIAPFTAVAAPTGPGLAEGLARGGAGDKAAALAGSDSDAWVPAAWREEGAP